MTKDGTLFLWDDDAAAAILTELQNSFTFFLLQNALQERQTDTICDNKPAFKQKWCNILLAINIKKCFIDNDSLIYLMNLAGG